MSNEIINRVWKYSQQQGTKLVLLLAMADMANSEGYCWPSLDKLQEMARLKHRQNAIRSIEELEADGEIWVEHNRGRGRTNGYIVAVGMDGNTLAKTLIVHFNYKPIEAMHATAEFMKKRSPQVKNVASESHLEALENVAPTRENVTSELKNVAPTRVKRSPRATRSLIEPLLIPNDPKEDPTRDDENPTNLHRARVKNRLVGFSEPLLEHSAVNVSEPTINCEMDSPPLAAKCECKSLPAAPHSTMPIVDALSLPNFDVRSAAQGNPPLVGTNDLALAYVALTAPEVTDAVRNKAHHEATVRRWLTKHEPLWLIQHVAVWWDDREQGKVDSAGALEHRIDNGCVPNHWPEHFLASEFYQRIYPLARADALRRERLDRYGDFADRVHGMAADLAWATSLPADLVHLLNALPVPLWDE